MRDCQDSANEKPPYFELLIPSMDTWFPLPLSTSFFPLFIKESFLLSSLGGTSQDVPRLETPSCSSLLISKKTHFFAGEMTGSVFVLGQHLHKHNAIIIKEIEIEY